MKFSIVIPVFNGEKYIAECVDSVLRQTYTDFELIIVNDGSTDKTTEIILEIAQSDARMKIIEQPNGGVLEAWVNGVKNTVGDYIISVDGDDIIENDLLEKLVKVIGDCEPDIVAYPYVTFDNDGGVYGVGIPLSGLYRREQIESEIFPKLINGGTFENRAILHLSRINKVIRRDLVFNNLKYCRGRFYYGEDNLCAIPNVLDAESIFVFGDYYPYRYRSNASSITHSYHENLWKQFVELDNYIIDILTEKKHPELIKQVYCDAVFHAAVSINNVIKGGKSYLEGVEEIKTIINHELVREGLPLMDKKNCSMKEKINLFLLKHRLATILYVIKKCKLK